MRQLCRASVRARQRLSNLAGVTLPQTRHVPRPQDEGPMMTQEKERLAAEAHEPHASVITVASGPPLVRKVFNVLTAALVLALVGVAVLVFMLTRPR
jgi:hypothetical protein